MVELFTCKTGADFYVCPHDSVKPLPVLPTISAQELIEYKRFISSLRFLVTYLYQHSSMNEALLHGLSILSVYRDIPCHVDLSWKNLLVDIKELRLQLLNPLCFDGDDFFYISIASHKMLLIALNLIYGHDCMERVPPSQIPGADPEF